MQGSKVCMARLVGDDDFAVQQRPSGQTGGRLYQFGKRGREIAKVSTEHLYVAICPSRSKPRKPSSLGSYNHWSPIGRLCLSVASIGENGNTSTGARGYQSKGNPRHAPESISDWRNALGPNVVVELEPDQRPRSPRGLSTPILTASSLAVTAAGVELKQKMARPNGSAQECGIPHSCSNELTTEGLTPSLVTTAASASS